MSSLLPFSERNLILTGYTGPNMAAIGRQIADQLRRSFVNVESIIAERMGLPVDEIRAYFGETRLKAVEAEIIKETALRRSTVIRVSGRTLVHGDNLARLQSTGPVICLVIGLDAMLQRMHVTMGARYHDPNERALALGELKREWAVRGMDGIIEVDTTYVDTESIIAQVTDIWSEIALERA